MTNLSTDTVREAIADHRDPETGRSIESTGQIRDIQVDGMSARLSIALASHSASIADEVRDTLQSKIVAAAPGMDVNIDFVADDRPPARIGQSALRIKSVIAVGSGKGGVGKSTVAASIALTLRRLGSKVGLMDADVYGPSIPHLLGLIGRPAVTEDKKIEPICVPPSSNVESENQIWQSTEMPIMSMGFLVEPDQAVIWRGPMLHGSINQFLNDTKWGELDYLIIDMPPGTGDVALTLSQALPLAGSVIVCTPQEVALLDAVKAISMFRKVNIPVLGMVENMSGFLCPDCGKTFDIFGAGGARAKAEELGVPFLGGLPIDITLRTAGDEGRLPQVIDQDKKARAPLEAVTKALIRSLAAKSATTPSKPSLPTL